MYTFFKKLLPVIFSFTLVSCIHEGENDCGIYVEFIFDYNMEYADSFDPQVDRVDVYIFDEDGKYLFHQHSGTSELINRKRMFLHDNFSSGTYQLIIVGGMSEHFRFTDSANEELIPGVTTLEEVTLFLQRTAGTISHEFPHLWFGKSTSIRYQGNASVWPVYLVRNTNRFHVMLESKDDMAQLHPETPPYTFEIITPEGARYGYDNAPLVRESVTYKPYSLKPGNKPENMATGKLNTMRLFTNYTDGYKIIVRKTDSREEVWSYDLIELLAKTKPSTRPDGTTLPLQEYLDRQGEWNIVILYHGANPNNNEAFLAVAIEVNGWIIWLNDIEI